MANLIYSIKASKPVDTDVVGRRLQVFVNGVRVSVKTYPTDTENFDQIIVDHDDEVTISLYDIDRVGNVSEPAVLEFIAKDTISPEKPQNLEYALEGQVKVYHS
jgi:hypothetical protein